MTSKRKLRAEIERLEGGWWSGFDFAIQTATGTRIADPAPWAAHLARVADAAREQGRQEGWTQAWAAGARADEDAYRRGWDDAVADATLAAGDDATPEDAEPSAGEVNRFSADGPCCGFACCCQHPPVAGWTPGSVTR